MAIMHPSSYTIIFVPGAWHSAKVFAKVGAILDHAGYQTDYVELASYGPKKHLPNWDADVELIQQHITKAVESGRKAVLVGHSYGGIPAAEAIQPFGSHGAVAHLFLCCSFIIPKGATLISAFGGNDLPWFRVSEDKLEVNPATPEDVFYNGLSHEQIADAMNDLKPHSYQVMHSPLTYEGWRHVPTTYLYCSQDAAIPPHIQKLMVEETAKGVDIRTETCEAGHSPMINRAEDVAAAIKRSLG